jgi:hypothetical protein
MVVVNPFVPSSITINPSWNSNCAMSSNGWVSGEVGGAFRLSANFAQISRTEYQVEFGGERGHWAEDDPRSNPESIFHSFFIIQRHVVKHLPKDAQRVGVNETEICLAFPISRNGCGSRVSNTIAYFHQFHSQFPID